VFRVPEDRRKAIHRHSGEFPQIPDRENIGAKPVGARMPAAVMQNPGNGGNGMNGGFSGRRPCVYRQMKYPSTPIYSTMRITDVDEEDEARQN
jgi:hypothetical protein